MAFISKLVQWRQNFLLAEVNHSDDIDSTVGWCGKVCSNLHRAASAWLNTFVISISPNNGEWHFRTLFVAEITILPVVLSFLFVFWWVLNRNTRMRKTRGSSIPHKEDDSDYDDDDDDDDEIDDGATIKSQTKIRKRKALERQKLQALRKAYDVEIEHDDDDDDDDDDDGGDDDETILSADSSLEDSDYDEDNLPYSQSSSSTINTDTDKTASQMFLSEEKAGLLKVVREIPILSFFNEEAMAMCMNDIEYINLDKTNDLLWDEGKFDGSLYYIVEGKIRVNFLDFEAPPADQRDHRKKEVASVIHEEETVVTSLLALMEGMVQSHLSEKGSLDRFVGLPVKRTTAQAIEDCTRLLRIPPSCFSRILDRFPETILRIVQTTLNRTQRVTVQTLVRCCGLRQELLVPTNKKLKKSMLAVRSSHWNPLQITLAKLNKSSDVDLENISDNDNKSLMKNACAAFASVLGIKGSATIEVLEEKCSLITLDTQGDESSRILLEAGSNHGSCYLLLQGAMEIGLHLPLGGFSSKQLQNDANAWDFQRIEIISPGSILGESALFTTDINLFEIRACVPASEYCNKPAILLRIPKDVYAHLVVKHPQAMAISLVPVLSVLSPVVHLLTWTTEWMHVEAAREIVHKGSPCNSLYIVLNGRLRATNRSKARNRVLGGATSNVVPPEEYGRGKIFGQVGSLANVDWPFDVFAIRQSELAKVPIKTLEIVVQNYPHAGLFLARVVASHVESLYFSKRKQTAPTSSFAENRPVRRVSTIETESQRSRIPKPLPYNLPSYGLNLATIAVVPLSYNIDLKRFCNTFFKAMQTIAPCKLLTKSFVKQELGEKVYNNRNALHDLKMTRLLADVEENNRVVIYQADPKFTFWTRLSVLQADCILLVVDSQHAPETSRVEQTLAWAYEAMDVRIELVVVGKEETKLDKNDETDIDEDEDDKVSVSDQLNNWSESRKWIAGHHLVRAPFGRYRIDFRRMCRRITGRSVGLVLGAGGARGIAHLGVIRALTEAGITVDMVGGTSQGAFAGALFAKNPDDYNQVLEAFRIMAADASSMKEKLLDLTLPMASMFAGRRFNKGIRKLLGNMRIQDLVLNFFCVSVDLQNQNTIVHTKGLLWKYVRASMGLTGYLPPISEDKKLLVDGAYLNSLPADVMRYKMGARTVITVDVSTESKREYYEYGTHLSGWWVLYNSWNPFVKTVKVPSMGDISDMLIWVSSEQHRKSVKVASDLYLTPPIQDIGTLEYDKFDEIVDTSYLYAKPIVDEWVRKNPWLVSQIKDPE